MKPRTEAYFRAAGEFAVEVCQAAELVFWDVTIQVDRRLRRWVRSWRTGRHFRGLSRVPLSSPEEFIEDTDPAGFVPIAEVRRGGMVIGTTDGDRFQPFTDEQLVKLLTAVFATDGPPVLATSGFVAVLAREVYEEQVEYLLPSEGKAS